MQEQINVPNGGWRRSPFFSLYPTGCRSLESASLQKSFLSSPPSSRRPSLDPRMLTTDAMQVEVRLRGSDASNFIPTLNSLDGGIGCWTEKQSKLSCNKKQFHIKYIQYKMESTDSDEFLFIYWNINTQEFSFQRQQTPSLPKYANNCLTHGRVIWWDN